MIYFDANATTVVTDRVAERMFDALRTGPLNPSSAHRQGQMARRLLTSARDTIADFLSCDADNLFFTSGGTEGDNIVINGMASIEGSTILCSAVEHASVIGPCSAAPSSATLEVASDGRVGLDALERRLGSLSADSTVLVCVQAANSETGILQDIESVARIFAGAAARAFLLVDGAQAIGRIQLGIFDGIDAVTFSGHKLHAPAGTGALYISDELLEVLRPTAFGGGQGSGIRPGTQAVAAACALQAAIEERFGAFDEHVNRLAALRNRFERGLRAKTDAIIVGADIPRGPNTTNAIFKGRDALALLAQLDDEGVMCSTGSACSSARPEGSPTLKAMGYSERDASSALRFSFSVLNDEEEVDAAVEAVARIAGAVKG